MPGKLLKLLVGKDSGGLLTHYEALIPHLDICTWIVPLILCGHVREVTWVSAWWCSQIDPGDYRLRVGLVSGRIAIGMESGRSLEGCSLYWQSMDAWFDESALWTDVRFWAKRFLPSGDSVFNGRCVFAGCLPLPPWDGFLPTKERSMTFWMSTRTSFRV